MRKLSIFTILFLLFVAVGVVLSLRFFPSAYVAAFNEFSEEQLEVEQLDVSFFPLTVSIENFNYNTTNGQEAISVEKATLQSQPIDWLRGRNNYWNLELNDAVVNLDRLTQLNADSGSDTEGEVSALNVHRIVSSLSMVLRSITIELDEHSVLSIKQLSTHLNDANLADFSKVEQDIDFSIEYLVSGSSEPLVLNGVFESRMVKGISNLALSLAATDLAPVLDVEDVVQEPSETSLETEMDWRWLSMLDPLKLDLKIEELVWSGSSVNDIELALGLNDEITFDSRSNVVWSASDQLGFDDILELKGVWNPISATSMGADLRGNLEMSTSALSAKLVGDVNINGTNGNKASLEISSKSMPLTTQIDPNTLALADQYFPIELSLQAEQLEHTTSINVVSALFGESDIYGSVVFDQQSDDLLSIDTNLNSKKVIYKSPEVNEQSDSHEEAIDDKTTLASNEGESDEQTPAELGLFSDEVIDWSWLNDVAAKINWQAETVIFDDIEITGVQLPISLRDRELDFGLDIKNLASGTLALDGQLKKNDQDAQLNMSLTASDVVLEHLHLLPPEELQNGVTDLRLNLTSNGNTSHELASSLNGAIKMNIGAGVVGNNSFELIGSDLILGILNKLNPFSKSDKTTELQCAVANLKVENGKIDIKKSLALKTSKLTIVADGYIDLAADKIKLDITPKARSGVGIDASSLVKFVALGGTVMQPTPVITAAGAVKSAAIVGAAVSTGGISLLATNAVEKTLGNVDVCDRADKAFSQAGD